MDNQIPRRSRQEKRNSLSDNNFLLIRNILNSIFILGALVGMGVYFWKDQTTGGVIIIGAMVFKFVECCLRFIHR